MEEQTKHSILIIDDDSFLLDMYALKFGQSGFDVHTALGSVPALEQIRGGLRVDVILLDIVMPVMDGFELLAKLNEEHLAEGSVKVVLSNRGMASDQEEGAKLGASGYIVKANNTPSEVVAKVKEILSAKGAQSQPAS